MEAQLQEEVLEQCQDGASTVAPGSGQATGVSAPHVREVAAPSGRQAP